MDRITVDFERTLRQAAQLDEYAESLRKMTTQEYAQAMQALSNDWKSDSASSFFAKGDTLRRSMEDTARDIEVIAANLRRAARRVYEAEKRAEEIARQREWGR